MTQYGQIFVKHPLRQVALSSETKANEPSMISCLACMMSRWTWVSISCLSASRSAKVTDGGDAGVAADDG